MRRTCLTAALLGGVALLAAPSAHAASWTDQGVSDPTGATASGLSGVACVTATTCLATGRWDDISSGPISLGAEWSGASWSLQPPATPAGALSDELAGISCVAVRDCTAVGTYDTGAGPSPHVQTWTGGWAIETAPRPAGATSAQLVGISCSTGGACTAVGVYTDAGGTYGLAMRRSGGTWSLQATPSPTGATMTSLAGVSCDASENCTAVGTVIGGGGVPEPVVISRSGGTGTWTVEPTPMPAGGASFLSGVSCDASGGCTAVGVETDARTGDAVPLAMFRSSGRWTLSATPPLPPGAQGGMLSGVSCTASAADCTAVGLSYDSGFVVSPLAEDLSGTTWSEAAPPLPSGSTSGQLVGVSCSASLECTATGSHVDANGDLRALIDRYE